MERKIKIGILGGAGYLGNHITHYFHKASGMDSEALSRQTNVDITKKATLDKLPQYDIIIHMAAKIDKNPRHELDTVTVNTFGTENVMSMLKDWEGTLIFTSTKDIYTPTNPYARSKKSAENIIINRISTQPESYHQMRYCILRLGTCYAPAVDTKGTWVNMFFNKIKRDEEIELYLQGTQIRDFLYVTDLARAMDKFIKSDRKNVIYDIGGGKDNACSIKELVMKMGKILNKKPKIKYVDTHVQGQIHYITDNRKIEKELDWYPQVLLEKGLREI